MGLNIRSEDHRIALKIFITVYVVSVLFFKPSPTFYRFVSLTKSLVHHGTTSVDRVHEESGLPFTDEIQLQGRTFIEVNPGLSFFAVASYFPYAKLILPKAKQFSAWNAVLDFKISQFVMALSTVIFFTALLIAIFFLALRHAGCGRAKAFIFSGLLYVGTPILYYSLTISNSQNTLEAALLFIAFFCSWDEAKGIFGIFLSGLLLGLAFFTSVTAVFFFPLFVWILWRSRRRQLPVWLAAGFIGSIPLFIYNFVSFGHPLTVSLIAYARGIPPVNFPGIVRTGWALLFDPRVGLFFFFPFLLMLIPSFRSIYADRSNHPILFGALIYLIGVATCFYGSLLINPKGEGWYLLLGGGGPRYLLPLIPFSVYVIASIKFSLDWKGILTAILIFLSVLINVPGLFWSGGEAGFLNLLFLFLKNGFHSYMGDLIRDLLILMGFQAERFSMVPIFMVALFFLWWIWVGHLWMYKTLAEKASQ